jgi:transcription antitermination factor NusG
VRTCHGSEITADIEIRLLSFTVFSPSVWKPATPARRGRNGAVRAAKPDRIVPLFPRYLFARFNRGQDDWKQIRHLPGVERIIFSTSPEFPAAMPDQAIETIRALCAANDCIYPDNVKLRDRKTPVIRPEPLPAGMNARLLHGPLADLTGICEWSDGRRVRLLLSLLGRAVTVTVPQAEVEAVSNVEPPAAEPLGPYQRR